MGLLDFDYNQIPKRFKPPRTEKSEVEKLSDLNNLGREKVTEDFSDSIHLT